MAEKLKVYVITMREIFCQALEKARAIEPDGSIAERRGDILVRDMQDKVDDEYGVLRLDSRPGYYNDRITQLYDDIKAGDLLKSKRYDPHIMMPIIEYAGYKDKIADLNSFFRRSDLSSVSSAKLLSFTPLLEAGRLSFVSKNKTVSARGTAASSDQEITQTPAAINNGQRSPLLPLSINILYSANPFCLLRYPHQGVLKLAKDDRYEFIPAAGDTIDPGLISGVEVVSDENRSDTWIKIIFPDPGKVGSLYIAEFVEPDENDEFYMLVQPHTLIAALIADGPAARR
jgi:hypothetical protein